MDLAEARELALQLMKKHGLEYRWRFDFDNAKRRLGACHHEYNCITLSKHLVLLNDIDVVRNTILHEIAHALVDPKYGHNWVWRQKALEIGCDGNRCYSSKKVNGVPKNVVAKCTYCGYEYKRLRMPSRKKSCGKCDNVFNEKYLLEFKRLA